MGYYLEWFTDFWVWCSQIMLILMIFADAKRNEWSKPRDYVLIVLLGPFTLAYTIYIIITSAIEQFKQKHKKE